MGDAEKHEELYRDYKRLTPDEKRRFEDLFQGNSEMTPTSFEYTQKRFDFHKKRLLLYNSYVIQIIFIFFMVMGVYFLMLERAVGVFFVVFFGILLYNMVKPNNEDTSFKVGKDGITVESKKNSTND